jgi:hypothetical protein
MVNMWNTRKYRLIVHIKLVADALIIRAFLGLPGGRVDRPATD